MKKYIGLLLILLLIPFTSVLAAEKTISQWEAELKKEQKALEDTNSKKTQTQKEINAANNKINTIYSQIEEIQKEIEEKTEESKQLEIDIEKKNKETEELMRYYQVSSSGSAMLEYIMGAESITDLIYRLSITEQISSYNKRTIAKMNEMIKENERIKIELNEKSKDLKLKKEEINSQVEILNKTKATLDEEGHTLEESIKEMQKTIKYYVGLGCYKSETISKCQNRLYGNDFLPSGTTFYRPTASGRISSNYGWRTLYGKPNMHAAIDISTPIGTPVYAVASGRVAKVKIWDGKKKDGGTEVIIHHKIGGKTYTSYYAHLSTVNVSVGTIVTKDTIIAKSGNTGNSTGPHLHLGLATGQWYEDYYSYYGNSGFIGHSFDPRDVIVFPAKGSSYYNR